MIVSRRWLEDLLGRPLTAADVAERITRHCAPVESVTPIHQDLGDVLVARVLEVRRHPNADRLSLCLVDAGGAGGPLEVVCGAPNVTAGRTYAFAPVGTALPGGVTLERRTIRGVESNGMLCSARELGLGDDHEGILELDTPAPPGTRLLDAVPLADDRIDIEVFANRPDLLGHKGVARELAAVLGGTVKLPALPGAPSLTTRAPVRQSARGVLDGLEVRLEDPEGAPRYLMSVIRGVRVGPSPGWLARRLASVGQRPINNVVDATNYILLELSQPLHAFDLARLRGPAVVVRRARPAERIVTLDGVERTLSPEMTVIADAERPTIIAGVMGSADSGVTETTRDVVLECACFEGTRIRRTRRALGLTSESSYRFERGIDVLGMPDALRRAVELIVAVAGGEQREPPLDLWPEPRQPRIVFLRPARVSHLLGTDVPRADTERLLATVGFVAAPKGERLAVQVPGWRPDVTREVDLIEEVARLRGYDDFPDDLRAYRPTTVPSAPIEGIRAEVRAVLAGAGLLEARTSPLGPPDTPDAIPLRNPLSAEDAHLRSRLLPGLARRVQHNWAQRTRDVRLFEVGTVFKAGKGGAGSGKGPLLPPQEEISVAGVITGARRPPHWTDGSKVPDMDIWDLKHHFELAVGVAFPGARVQVATDGPGWEAEAPGGARVGWAGPLRDEAPVWAAPLFGFEVRLSTERRERVRYRALPVMPAVERDVALVLPAEVSAAAVEATLRRAAGPLLERLEAFDEFRGGSLPAGSRSVAWHCAFRDPEDARTLRENEVDGALGGALRALEDELGVRRRAG